MSGIDTVKRAICPVCDSDLGFDRRDAMETVEVRGEEFTVPSSGWECKNCGEILDGDDDPLDCAYRKYRDRHDIPQPEAIKFWRDSLGITQKELADLLGWGHVTLSRYENGALPSEAHGRRLAQVMGAAGLVDAIEVDQAALSPEKRQFIIEKVHTDLVIERAKQMLNAAAGGFAAGIVNGMREFSAERATAVAAALAENGEFKTKLNKLLFYVDFRSFRDLGISVTGMRYARIPYGPVPENYESVFASMACMSALICEPWETERFAGEIIKPAGLVNLSILTPQERAIVTDVKSRFRAMSASEIAEFSHQERAWKEVQTGKIIPYTYAKYLLI